jgi:hypothetical protein
VSRPFRDTGAVYRVHIDYVPLDEAEEPHTVTYGPFASKTAARLTANPLLKQARSKFGRATARYEEHTTPAWRPSS